MIKRVYFYSGQVHMPSGVIKHIDGVIEVTSWFKHAKAAWTHARGDIIKAINGSDEKMVHIQTINEI